PVKGGRAPAEVAQETSERGTVAVVVASLAPRLLQLGERRHQRLGRSEEHTSELQSRFDLVCRLLLEKKKKSHFRYPPQSWPQLQPNQATYHKRQKFQPRMALPVVVYQLQPYPPTSTQYQRRPICHMS